MGRVGTSGLAAVVAVAAAFAVTCGGQPDPSSGVSDGGISSGRGSGSADTGLAWGATIPAGDRRTPVVLTMGPLAVAPGEEVYMCQVFDNPFGGINTDIVISHGVMSPGSHSFFLFNLDATTAAREPPVGTLGACAAYGLEFHPFPFSSQQPDWTVNYPTASDGSPMGYPLAGANSLMIYVHYVNVGSTTIHPTATVTLTPARAGVVTTHVGSIFLGQRGMTVPATATQKSPVHSTRVWPGDPSLAANYSLITSWSVMHRWGLRFTASTGGTVFYTQTAWDSPGLFIHAPDVPEPTTATGAASPVPMTFSSSITWDCADYNDTERTLTFGDSAVGNVACFYIGQYYPASPTSPDILSVAN
jgi:hypothetical protein